MTWDWDFKNSELLPPPPRYRLWKISFEIGREEKLEIQYKTIKISKLLRNSRPNPGNKNMFHVHRWDSSDLCKSQSPWYVGGEFRIFPSPRNMKKMKTYEEIWRKYEEIWRNKKELLSPYIGRGTWKNFKLVPLGQGGFAKYELGGRREKRHEICQ